jgi:hypothetical protein
VGRIRARGSLGEEGRKSRVVGRWIFGAEKEFTIFTMFLEMLLYAERRTSWFFLARMLFENILSKGYYFIKKSIGQVSSLPFEDTDCGQSVNEFLR